MEKIKEKLVNLRAEVETATNRANELQERAKQLEDENKKKETELTRLQGRAKDLEEELENSQTTLKETKENFHKADLRAEQLTKKSVKLSQELAVWNKKNADLEEKYLAAKKEMDELEGQMEGV